ncbi:MAG TPA: hypothetical protein VND80_04655 [Steroidobacteraceae bacterium]|nr:hypothetical protein [Steroidobacteraceae bacterium]
MRQHLVFAALAAAAVFGAAQAARTERPLVSKDLMATIALQGKRCDKIVAVKRNGDSDYSVKCRDGNRYHIYVDSQGRVVVTKL